MSAESACPNCGAPRRSAASCEYCGSRFILAGDYRRLRQIDIDATVLPNPYAGLVCNSTGTGMSAFRGVTIDGLIVQGPARVRVVQ